MNPVYSPAPTGVPFTNTKGIGYPAGFPVGYAAAPPTYTPSVYPGASPAFPSGENHTFYLKYQQHFKYYYSCIYMSRECSLIIVTFHVKRCTLITGYSPGTPFKMTCSPNTGTVPPYTSSPNPYPAAVYPVRSTYPQQNPYAQALIPSQQQGTYYTQPLYAAPPHVIHHTTVVQPNGMPATMFAPPIPPPHRNGVPMGMVAGTTMAMSAGTLLTTPSPAPVAPHPVTMPTYRPPGTPSYSYVPPQW
ncbi:myelin-associated neurite-outgrowth inhibitor isoform X1 [Boleophthalmus pectinirostris]|uniref:myelin-associated neurite-outgrowth inhibitor isoform X1 n=1 Tax=Boleophthalmus pectinirostris TaxID=150288 RepID=UPI000A1C561E|nr:myelin-associated neurite-outgrowth inhibitor isoform X1 [Boleophthalmus pectinirostris]XP_055006867.1 myelin-associated neurite-outgrowth inhibitor isoform X1 [Boleophthalmus pectinirostris]